MFPAEGRGQGRVHVQAGRVRFHAQELEEKVVCSEGQEAVLLQDIFREYNVVLCYVVTGAIVMKYFLS